MLYERYGNESLDRLLQPATRFAPIPGIDEREAWESLLPESREMWISLAERHQSFEWPAVRTSDYMDYWRLGDLAKRSNAIFERRCVLGILAIAECMEDKGRFLDQIINGIYVTCEETTWVPPLHRLHWKVNVEECLPDVSDHMVELMTAEASKLLCWVYYLLQSRLDAISKRLGERIVREVKNRLLQPYMAHDDYWWMGFKEGVRVNNWNPWCNGAVLTGFLLLENDSAHRREGLSKVMRSLDAFIRTYPPDGCCDEGPTYWSSSGGALFDCLELLSLASDGRIDIFDEPIIRAIGAYMHKVHIHDDFYVAFADCDAKADPGGDILYRFGLRTDNELMVRLGTSRPISEPPRMDIWFNMYGYLRDLFDEQERLALAESAPYVRDAWLDYTQVMSAREREGTSSGLYVAAKGGHNAESHNHNDVGSFIVFADGRPVLIDLGTEEYTAKTFGPERYELWYLQSQYHNLPTVRGVLQQAGKQFCAANARYGCHDAFAEADFDIAGAYPSEAGIVKWRRTVRLSRGNDAVAEVTDDFMLKGEPGDISYSLITPCTPELVGLGVIELPCAPGRIAELRFDQEWLEARVEPITWTESRLRRNWGDSVYRIVLAEKTPVVQGVRVLSIRLHDRRGED